MPHILARPGPRRTARVLGLASTGRGVAMLRDPKGVTRVSGVDDSATALSMIPVVDARTLLHALPLVAGRPAWAWTRVAGDPRGRRPAWLATPWTAPR